MLLCGSGFCFGCVLCFGCVANLSSVVVVFAYAVLAIRDWGDPVSWFRIVTIISSLTIDKDDTAREVQTNFARSQYNTLILLFTI